MVGIGEIGTGVESVRGMDVENVRRRGAGSVGGVNRVDVGNVRGMGKEEGVERGVGGGDGAILSLTRCGEIWRGFAGSAVCRNRFGKKSSNWL